MAKKLTMHENSELHEIINFKMAYRDKSASMLALIEDKKIKKLIQELINNNMKYQEYL